VNRPLPKKAATTIRLMIVDCLRDGRYRIYADGQRYLSLKEIRARHIIEDLIEEIEDFHIFELPAQGVQKQTRQKYQYVIEYNNPDLFVHVKMTPDDHEPPTVFLGFHSHNTGFDPLPRITAEED
jgi:predicted DNA-binding protein